MIGFLRRTEIDDDLTVDTAFGRMVLYCAVPTPFHYVGPEVTIDHDLLLDENAVRRLRDACNEYLGEA